MPRQGGTQMNTGPNALFVHPRFIPGSFWHYVETCKLTGARSPSPPLGLITVAAMLPDHWEIRLCDCNVQSLRDADLRWADVVLVGAMLPQQRDALHLIARCRAAGVPVVVGGPDATSAPDIYSDADFRVLGEVEDIIADFISAFEDGARQGDFVAEKFKADITRTPVPRFDLLKFGDYLEINVQFSRGCPFLCEFCDIIELYGRNPRTKTTSQMLAELQAIYDLGHRGMVQFVDDNLIGNKKAVKAFLPHLVEWQKTHGYPFEFSTEASLNLADDEEFLGMMRDANFVAVFVGIESPDPDVLITARKKQNTRRDIVANVHTIQSFGMFVTAGFIVGFDDEKPGVAETLIDLIEACAIPVAMTGLLFALPNTQLSRRLEREGRLFDDFALSQEWSEGDQCTDGLNFVTARPRAEVLRDYRKIIARTFAPDAFFSRVLRSVAQIDASGTNGQMHRARLSREILDLLRLVWSINTRHAELRRPFWRLIVRTLRTNPNALKHAIYQAALYVHLGRFSGHILKVLDKRVAEIESGEWSDTEFIMSGKGVEPESGAPVRPANTPILEPGGI